MILPAEHVRLIRAGKKTQMRAPIQEPRDVTRSNGTSYRSQPFRPHIGQRVPISVLQTIDGKPRAVPQCTILVEAYTTALLGDGLDVHVAHGEGHKTTDEFKTWWVRRHDKPWLDTQTKRLEIEPGDDLLLERFDKRHVSSAVWIVTFKHDPVVVKRCLAPFGRGDERGYTTNEAMAVREAGEAVDELTQRRLSDQGREYDHLRASGAAEEDLDVLREIDATIGRLRVMSTRHGVSFRDEIRRQQQTRSNVERKIREQVERRRQAARAA